MGLRSGNTVLIYFRSGVDHYQSVLIALAVPTSRGKASISFGSMSRQFALTFLGYLNSWLALTAVLPWKGAPVSPMEACTTCRDGSPISGIPWSITGGDTKSAQELEVFLRMPRERLRLCCGIQCTDNLHPNGPRQRRKLFTAALKLLRFAIGIETVCCENEGQRALHAALLPLLRLEDGHVLATLSAIVLALCEGRTGLAISGVFGAGKTRSAAALLAGLLVFDPSLQLMVLTKENMQLMQLLSIWFPCRCLTTFKTKWGDWLDTMSRTVRAPTLHSTFFLPTGTRSFDRSHSSLDAEVAFNRNVV